MIAAVVGILTVAVIFIVRARRQSAAIDRELMMPSTPPPMVEISADPRIPLEYRTHAASLGKRIVAGESPPTDTSALWYDGPLLEEVQPTIMNGRGETIEVPQLGESGPRTQLRAWFNEYSDYRIATVPRTTPVRVPAAEPESGTRYYAGGGDLDRLIADPAASIHDVIREVENLCDREFHASKYYRDNPHLQYAGHPWMKFVASGNAAYLGWEPGEEKP